MAARAISSATISFALVSIPVKLFTACSSESVSFHMITPGGHRVKQKWVDAETGDEVERDACLKGYEYAKGQFAIFKADEIKALEAEKSPVMDIKEFVALDAVDLLAVEKSYYLGPDKGADKAYTLLANVMQKSGKVAVARYAARGKEQLVIIRPYRGGLVLHQMFYSNEVRDFEEIKDKVATIPAAEVEEQLSLKLIEQLSSNSFDPSKYQDDYAVRVRKAVDQKVAGQEVTIAAQVPSATVLDLMAALKASLEKQLKKD